MYVQEEQVEGIYEDEYGQEKTFLVTVSSDGVLATGNLISSIGNKQPITLLLNKEKDQMAGNINGITPFCATRGSINYPKPCFTEIRGDWAGEWWVWAGPDEDSSMLVFYQNGNRVDVLFYEFSGETSEGGRVLTGDWHAYGMDGNLVAKKLDNGIQFNGNMNGMFPFCGVRPGGSKPDPCMGP